MKWLFEKKKNFIGAFFLNIYFIIFFFFLVKEFFTFLSGFFVVVDLSLSLSHSSDFFFRKYLKTKQIYI